MIRRPIDYIGKARRLAARRRNGGAATAGPVHATIPPVKDKVHTTTPEVPSILPTGFKATCKYALIAQEDRLSELVEQLQSVAEIALDVETYPLDESNTALDPRRGRIRLISVAAEGGVGGVVDVTKVDPLPLLQALQGKTLITHNGKFDLSFLRSCFGYEHDGTVVDTQVLDAVLYYAAGPRHEKPGWKGFPKGAEVRRRSLKDVAAAYLDTELSKEEQTSGFGQEELTEEQVRYSLKDAEVLLPLKEAMMRRVRELGLERIAELEARVVPALAYCENNGFAIDEEGWREEVRRATEEAERFRLECDTLAPPIPEDARRESWNWNSAKQVGEAFEILGVELPKTENGNSQTGDAVLKRITSPENAARLALKILHYREMKKRTSTWGLGWFEPPQKKKHQIVVSGRAHTSFQQVIKTGRMSSSHPNLQNIPPEFRRLFVAPTRRKLLVADYKHIELVPAAVVAGEEKLIEAFRNGIDVHSLTARGILESDSRREGRPVTEEEIQAMRPRAKLVAFGVLYGITAKGLAQRITNLFGASTSEEEAQALIDRFFDTYPNLKRWYQAERRKAKSGKDQTRTLAGRLRLLDVEYRYGRWQAKLPLRLNTPIQGSAGDGFKYALASLWEKRHECPGSPKVVNLVHDEIVVEIDEEYVDAGKAWVEQCMVKGMQEVVGEHVPVSVEMRVARSWSKGD